MRLFRYQEGDSFLHEASAISKVGMGLILVLLGTFSYSLIKLAFLVAMILLIFVASLGRNVNLLKPYLKVSLIMAFTTISMQAIFYWKFYLEEVHDVIWLIHPRDLRRIPLLGSLLLFLTYGKGVAFSWEGFLYGVLTALKFILALLVGAMITLTTRPSEFLRELRDIGLPPMLVYAAIITIRFIPLLIEEGKVAVVALRSRGGSRRGVIGFMNRTLYVMIINTIKRAKMLAIALELKGFGCMKRRKRGVRVVKKGDLKLLIITAMTCISVLLIP